MLKRYARVFLFAIFLYGNLLFAEKEIPQPSGWVNDFAGVISQEYRQKLNSLISELEEKTSSELAVVTVDSIAPYDEKEYARLLFDNWKPGKKGKDNGVLVLLAIKERRWRIETGYGIEGILPDGLCGEIGRNYMVTYFKEGKFDEGLYQGVLKISQVIAKDANVNLKTLENLKELPSKDEEVQDPIIAIIVIIVLSFIVILLKYVSERQKRYGYRDGIWGYSTGGGGGWGGGGGFGGGGFGGGGFGGGGGGGGGAGGGF